MVLLVIWSVFVVWLFFFVSVQWFSIDFDFVSFSSPSEDPTRVINITVTSVYCLNVIRLCGYISTLSSCNILASKTNPYLAKRKKKKKKPTIFVDLDIIIPGIWNFWIIYLHLIFSFANIDCARCKFNKLTSAPQDDRIS